MALVGLSPSLPLWAGDQPADEPTKEERDQWQRRAEELVKQAKQLSQQGKYPDATKRWKQIIAIYQKLYPKDQYPNGHADLATGLNNLALLLATQEDYLGAQTYYQQSLEMRRSVLQRPLQ